MINPDTIALFTTQLIFIVVLTYDDFTTRNCPVEKYRQYVMQFTCPQLSPLINGQVEMYLPQFIARSISRSSTELSEIYFCCIVVCKGS